MIRRIVLGHDFSKISTRAEEYVTQIASNTDSEVMVLHAIEPIEGVEEGEDSHFEKFITSLKEQAREKADVVLERLTKAGIKCQTRVLMEKRWKAVLEVSDEWEADLIVLGSHTIREEGKVYLGTTSHKVFFASDRPLMIVPQG